MDSADPRTQPATQTQQPHHHHTQHHHSQQRQPQKPLDDQQQPQQQPQPQHQPQQQPHHITQQLTQPQSLHQQQPITHPPQHAQPSQPTGYPLSQHNYPPHQMQLGHGYPHQTYQRNQYPYAPGLPATFAYSGFVPSYSQQHQQWHPPATFPAVPVSTPPVQGPASTLKPAPNVSVPPREKKVLVFIDPKTGEPINLEDNSENPSRERTNSTTTTSTATITTTPSKSTPTQQNKTTEATPTTTPTTIATTKESTPIQTPTNAKSAVPANATITNNNVTTSSSNDRASTSSPSISVSNILLQKVSEDTSSDKHEEVAISVTTPPVVASKVAVSSPTAKSVARAETTASTKLTANTATEVDSKDVSNVEKKSEVVDPVTVVDNVEQSDGDKAEQDDKVEEACDEDSREKEDANGEIKLHYEEGQYNPTSNRNGKKKYSREFMLEVAEKICKVDINSEVNSDSGGTSYNLDKSLDLFAPNYQQLAKYQTANRQNDPARRQNPNNYTGRSSAGQERGQRKVIVPSSSLTNEVELKTVSNPWRPGKEVKEEEVPDDVVEVEVLKKKFRSILNKLTPQNFDNLSEAVTKLHINTEAKLGEVIDIVFAKALAEPGYCVLYGQMCSHLKKITAGAANFGNTLLKRCQNQFQADIYSGLNIEERKKNIEEEQDPEKKKHLDEELYEDMYRCRMRGLGLIKFIGELYKIEMLIDPIMFDCITRLLGDQTSEESLECLCDLLKTIGEKLDNSSQAHAKEKQRSQKVSSKTNAYHNNNKSLASVVASSAPKAPEPVATLDPIFEQLHKIRKNKDLPLSVRIRFKLLDVCELREKDNWQSKGKDNNPKKLDEIKKDHLESERQKSMGPRKSQEGRRGLGHGGGSSNQLSSLGNDSGLNRTNFHSSASSQSIRDHAYGEKTLQNNSDNHKMQEQHRQNVSNMNSTLKNLVSRVSANDKTPSIALRPTIGRSNEEQLRPLKFNATATSNTTKSTTSAAANSASANTGGGGQ